MLSPADGADAAVTVAGMGLGIVLVLAAGALLVGRLWPLRIRPALLLAALAWPAGLALTSSTYFLWMVVSGGRASWYPWLELAGVAALAWLAWRGRDPRRGRVVWLARPRSGIEAAALVVLVLAVLTALVGVLRYAEVTPWGYWDAWARINLKARFLHAGGPEWTWIFRGDGMKTPDYPLLLECSVARLWRWSGGVGPLPAQTLSVLNWAACLGALVALVGLLRSTVVAAAAGLAFLCNQACQAWAAMQYADLVLATHFTCCAGLLVLAARRRGGPGRWWPLVGFFAGSAAWCKNEGLGFAALVVLAAAPVIWAARARRWRSTLALGTGLALGGACVLVLKLGFAGKSYLIGPRARPVHEDLIDPARYGTVFDYLLGSLRYNVAGWALLVLALALLVLPSRRGARRSWLPLALSAATGTVFVLVLVATSLDLDWQVSTTVERLTLELWPMAILGVAAGLRG